jgi:Integrase core domain
VLAAIEHATRRIRILGATAHPGSQWIVQQARNLCMDLGQAHANVKFVLHDRDATFHEGFDAVFTAAGLRVVRSGVRMPRMNSIMERWIGGCRRELLDRTLIWNLPHLRMILAACERHHNDHRPHMALSSAAPLKSLPAEGTDLEAFRVRRRDRVGGVIHEYQRHRLISEYDVFGKDRTITSPQCCQPHHQQRRRTRRSATYAPFWNPTPGQGPQPSFRAAQGTRRSAPPFTPRPPGRVRAK